VRQHYDPCGPRENPAGRIVIGFFVAFIMINLFADDARGGRSASRAQVSTWLELFAEGCKQARTSVDIVKIKDLAGRVHVAQWNLD
jgi:hypothetical protein